MCSFSFPLAIRLPPGNLQVLQLALDRGVRVFTAIRVLFFCITDVLSVLYSAEVGILQTKRLLKCSRVFLDSSVSLLLHDLVFGGVVEVGWVSRGVEALFFLRG